MGYNPSYKWINPTYPIYNWGYNPLTKWMSHQVYTKDVTWLALKVLLLWGLLPEGSGPVGHSSSQRSSQLGMQNMNRCNLLLGSRFT